MTIKSNILTDRQKTVIETIRMRLNEQQSLQYLKEVDFHVVLQHFTEKRRMLKK